MGTYGMLLFAIVCGIDVLWEKYRKHIEVLIEDKARKLAENEYFKRQVEEELKSKTDDK